MQVLFNNLLSLNFNQLFFSLAGGILPTILWLWLWLKEDKHPEPHSRIILAFLGGMVVVPLAPILQQFVHDHVASQTWMIVLWAAIEEMLKFGAAFFTSLTKRDNDEPVDSVIYLMTTALGFAAFENVLYLLDPIKGGSILNSVDIGNFRFIGANLIHIASSCAIGVSLGLAFYRSRRSKIAHFLVGFGISTALHSIFNLFIINVNGNKDGTMSIFFAVWVTMIILALLFEKIKSIHKNSPELIRDDWPDFKEMESEISEQERNLEKIAAEEMGKIVSF